MIVLVVLGCVLAALVLAYLGRPYWAWVVPGAALLVLWRTQWFDEGHTAWFQGIAAAFLLVAVVFGVASVRRAVLGTPLLRLLAPIFPKMSDTERIALEAGTVWWDAELFSGAPRWKEMLAFRPKPLSDDERKFLEGPCKELCRALDDTRVRRDGDLPREIWDFIKSRGFLGMIIPKEHGGLGFSALAHSSVVTMLSSRSVTACVSVMVPNSLGPAELLLHYGTDEQKKRWLPKLAKGEEIPCFALTEPHAGSDAGGMRAQGIVCKGTFEGREIVGMRLTWDKRYITLAPIATVVGLAFRLHDPDKLLGGAEDLGITCALIPRATSGVWIGHRHDPLGTPFMNGPTRGTDVFVPLDFIIGGPKMAGQGWRMLMECLSAGRSISLPANSTGGAQLATRTVGAYATIREQFNLAIGRFEGIEAPLARIAGTQYWLNALRELTAGAVDAGEKPAVISAIAKCWSTEAMRRVVNDAMDVTGGAGICRGPNNVLAPPYQAIPIGITVEGANILTRSMIVFGQGAIRCHPFALKEMQAASKRDVAAFDAAFFGHVGFVFTNVARSLVLGLTGGALAGVPRGGESGRALKRITRWSASFALVSDLAMGTLGGTLKRKEKITGRLADALAWMYIASAATKRFVDDGELDRDRALWRWAVEESLFNVQEALRGVLDNLPNRPAAIAVRPVVFSLGARAKPPSDRLTAACARAILDGGAAREALTRDIFVPSHDDAGLGRLEKALALTLAAEPARKKLRDAVKARVLPRGDEVELVPLARDKKVLDAREAELVLAAASARNDAIQVDDFAPEDYPADGGSQAIRAPFPSSEPRQPSRAR